MEQKWFLRSRMAWGLIFVLLSFYGVDVPPDVQARLPGLTANVCNQGMELIGLILAIYGARNGDKSLTVLPAKLPWRK